MAKVAPDPAGAMRLFATDHPPPDFLEALDRDGCVVLPACLTDEGSLALEQEMANTLQAQAWRAAEGGESSKPAAGSDTLNFRGRTMLVRGPVDEDIPNGVSLWPAPGSPSFQLIDGPLVRRCLELAMGGAEYHYCHGAFGFRRPGAEGIAFHQDHHHWKHENAVNVAERPKRYVQLLWYPQGFTRGDGSLRYIAGSHLEDPREADSWVNAGSVMNGEVEHNAPAKAGFESTDAELPPGSMVFIDARMYHAVFDKATDSPITRPFLISIFKEASEVDGVLVPHRYTQPVPECYPRESAHHRMLFDRPAWSEESWPLNPPAPKL